MSNVFDSKSYHIIPKWIINNTCRINVGSLTLKYGGGGHKNAGTCQLANGEADEHLMDFIARINTEG